MDVIFNNLLPIGLAVIVLIAARARIRLIQQSRNDVVLFERLPDLGAYLTSNPACRTPVGPICRECNSNQFGSYTSYKLRVVGWEAMGVTHYCKKCQTMLYRTGL